MARKVGRDTTPSKAVQCKAKQDEILGAAVKTIQATNLITKGSLIATLAVFIAAVSPLRGHAQSQQTQAASQTQTQTPNQNQNQTNSSSSTPGTAATEDLPAAPTHETHAQRVQKHAALKQVENVKAENKQLEQFRTPPPITGFHPIKKIVQPIKNLERTSEELNKQATKLEQPLSTLRQPIMDVQHGMTHVDTRVTKMQTEITGTEKQVEGVRSDIADMRKDIQKLKEPVVALQEPMEKVAGPLEAVQKQLKVVLLVIFLGSVGTAFGIPLTFVLLWRYRAKFFPGLSRHHIAKGLNQTFPQAPANPSNAKDFSKV